MRKLNPAVDAFIEIKSFSVGVHIYWDLSPKCLFRNLNKQNVFHKSADFVLDLDEGKS